LLSLAQSLVVRGEVTTERRQVSGHAHIKVKLTTNERTREQRCRGKYPQWRGNEDMCCMCLFVDAVGQRQSKRL
jgi:hypothetical protein